MPSPDTKSFEECSQDRANKDAVLGSARACGARPDDLADIEQETWAAVLFSWPGLEELWYRDPTGFRRKIRAIARNKAVDRMRTPERVRRQEGEEDKEDAGAVDPMTPLLQEDVRATYLKCLEQLERGHRDVWILSFHLTLSHAEIAHRLGISEALSRVKKHRATSLLRSCMEKTLGVQP